MLDQTTQDTIRHIIFRYIDSDAYNVFLFGSRASGKESTFSDIDIGIQGNRRVPGHIMQEIKGALEDSPIPYKIDVVDFVTVNDRFKKVALNHIQSARQHGSV